MAQLRNATRFKSPNPAVATFNVTIPATAAGSKLVCIAGGGAIITAKLGVGGTTFTKRTKSLSNREVAAQDIVDVSGGTTTIQISLNGPENVDGMIYEFASGSLGNFIAGNTESDTGNTPTTSEARAIIRPVTTTGPAVLFAMFTAGQAGTPAASDGFWGFEPLGKQYANEHIAIDSTKSKYWTMIAISDQLSAGTFTAQSVRTTPGTEHQSVIWAYENLEPAIPTYVNPYPNAIAAENSLPGSIRGTWFGEGTSTGIAGYADSMSYVPGDTVNLKVDSFNSAFTVNIYRLGFYGHALFGARKQTTVTGTPVVQPAPTVNSYGGTVCAWSTNATWTIPSDAVPGVYVFNMIRGAFRAQGIFVVRSTVPVSRADQIMIPTADFTWQAYNMWGSTADAGTNTSGYTGRNLYTAAPSGTGISTRAFAVSYDRPMSTVLSNATTYFWDSEFALINFLEGNGYDIAYYSMVDIEKNPIIPSRYKIAVSHGHSEYWTTNLRDAYEDARDAGTNLIFITGNTALWRVRFDATDTNCRNLICYKDSHDAVGFDGVTKYDPVSYTGTWRDMRTDPGGVNNMARRPEPGMTGQWFIGNGPFEDTVAVPSTYRSLPMWRNTRVANGVSITVRGTSAASLTTPATSITINQPAGTQAGDLLVLALTFTGSPGNITNAPFRIVRVQTMPVTNQTTVIAVGHALVAGSSAHAINWITGGPLNVSAVMVAYGNAVWEDVDTSLRRDTSGGSTHTTASISNGGTNRWAVCVFGDATTNGSTKTTAWTAGGGLTSRATAENSASGSGPWCSTAIMDTNGAVTQGSHQYSATANFANSVAFAGILYLSPGVALAKQTIGREWDCVKRDEPSTPTNMIMLSRQAFQLTQRAAKYNGDAYNEFGLFQYGMTLYQAPSGALVFNTGSWRYSFGLSRYREGTFDAAGNVDTAMQQSIINLIKDMGIAHGGLMSTVANVDSTPLVDPGATAIPAAYGFPAATIQTQYQTIFRTTPPIIYDGFDSGGDYTLGTVFTASVNGEIHGIRWHFPGQMPNVPVIGLLYSWSSDSAGTELARATFTNTQSGWNSVLFATPVAISAGSKYVAAVWTQDHYVTIAGQFASGGVTTGDLTAVQDSGSAHNGKLRSGIGAPSYPTNTFGSNGYLVDVLFVGKGFEGWGMPM